MHVSDEFHGYVMEQMKGLGHVSSRKMFGGYGIYRDGLFFAIIADDTLFLKADDANRPRFEDAGMEPFRVTRPRPAVMQYYETPPEVLEDAAELASWARDSLRAAARARNGT